MNQRKRFLAVFSAVTVLAASVMHTFRGSSVLAAETIRITPAGTYQINGGVFEGWGSSLCWWANRIGYNDTLSKQAAELFYGDSGLRMNIARFNIGGGDNPSHTHITRTDSNMPGYSVYNNGRITYDWNADANQRNVLNKILAAGGDDMIVEMFSNSPPYYMTNSGCSTGATDPKKNNLRDDQYTAFAEYLAEVCAHYQNEWGIEIQSIDPMNEPYTNYWGANSAKQEGCHFDQGNSESKMLTETKKALERHGLNNILLCGTDETSIDTAISSFNKLSADAKNAIGRIDTHSYGGSKRTELKNLAVSNGKNLWMSEVDGSKTAGTNAGAMGSGLWLAERITTDCNQMNASAWILWQLIDNHVSKNGYNGRKDSGMPNLNGGFWGVAVADHDKNEIILSKKYYSFGQYTRYIRPGMIMLNSSDTTMAAYDPKTGEIAIVAYNTGGGNRDLSFDLSGFQSVGTSAQGIRTSASENWKDIGKTNLSGKTLNVTLPANSIATYIIGGTGETTDRSDKIDLSKAVLSGTDSWHSEGSTDYSKAFDGSTATYFDGVGGGWVQADLGAVYTLTQIGYCPRTGHEARCVDAMIQVSDDGQNWRTVYTVRELPGGGMHYVKMDNISGRYVRYAVPEGAPQNAYNKDDVYCCNIAEIELYGSKAGRYIRSLNVHDTANAAAWSVVTDGNAVGSAVFGDRAFKFTAIPETVSGAEWIRTACDSKKYAGDEASFTAGADISVFVALDTRVTFPAWLSGWTKTADALTDDGEPQVTYQLYKKDFAAGETVTLGEVNQSGCVNYTVAVTAKQTAVMRGDINADGSCNKTDLVMMRDYLLKTGTLTADQAAAADMNRDGKINAKDLTLLKRVLLTPPAEEETVTVKNQYESADFKISGRVFTVGDSTVCEYDSNTQTSLNRYGWGMKLAQNFNNVTVTNLALSGRSSRSFLNENNYKTLKSSIGKGDYLIIQFGHNDEKTDESKNPGVGTYPGLDRNTLDSTGKDAQGRYSFEYILTEYYINLAKNAGAQPVLVTPITRRSSDGTANYKQHTNYQNAIKALGQNLNIPVIDMTALTTKLYTDLYNAGGANETAKMHCWSDAARTQTDNTHLSNAGATKIAQMVAAETKVLSLQLSGRLK